MRGRWELALLPPLFFSTLLLIVSQVTFLQGSLHADLGMGQLSPDYTFDNFIEFFSDGYYLRALGLSVIVSGAATVLTLCVSFPLAYLLARMEGRLSLPLLAAVVVSSFVTIVVKVLGLIILFSGNGPLNRFLSWLGLIDRPLSIIGTVPGAVIGLMYYALGFAVLLFYSLVVTVPRSVEEAAEIHGATRWRVMCQVVLPICLPGIAAAGLTVFNVTMSGFSSTALIGAGKVLTLPILLQRTVLLETNYGLGAAVAVVLLLAVLFLNIVSAAVLARSGRGVVA